MYIIYPSHFLQFAIVVITFYYLVAGRTYFFVTVINSNIVNLECNLKKAKQVTFFLNTSTIKPSIMFQSIFNYKIVTLLHKNQTTYLGISFILAKFLNAMK